MGGLRNTSLLCFNQFKATGTLPVISEAKTVLIVLDRKLEQLLKGCAAHPLVEAQLCPLNWCKGFSFVCCANRYVTPASNKFKFATCFATEGSSRARSRNLRRFFLCLLGMPIYCLARKATSGFKLLRFSLNLFPLFLKVLPF